MVATRGARDSANTETVRLMFCGVHVIGVGAAADDETTGDDWRGTRLDDLRQ